MQVSEISKLIEELRVLYIEKIVIDFIQRAFGEQNHLSCYVKSLTEDIQSIYQQLEIILEIEEPESAKFILLLNDRHSDYDHNNEFEKIVVETYASAYDFVAERWNAVAK